MTPAQTLIRLVCLVWLLPGPVLADPALSIDISLATDEEYGAAVEVIKDAGATVTSISIPWDEMETQPGRYSPENDWPWILNLFLPVSGLDVTLTFSVIDTVVDRRPKDLQGKAWDDPEVIARFANHVDAILDRFSLLDLQAISVGNEVDGLLSTPQEIAAYATFLTTARAHIDARLLGMAIGSKLTFSGTVADPGKWAPILNAGTVAMYTYYPFAPDFAMRPVSDVPADLDRMITMADGKPIYLLEAGYPSDGCAAEAGAQGQFVLAMLKETKARSDDFALMSFTFLTDLPAETVDQLETYYGVKDACFRRYLGTLGLRNTDGTFKPALTLLQAAGK